MNIILALVPAVAYGAVSPLVARMGERPVQQLMKTALGVLLLSSVLFVFTRLRFVLGRWNAAAVQKFQDDGD